MGQNASTQAHATEHRPSSAGTQPPVRLRMSSWHDQVAMEVKWTDQYGNLQRWSSEEDNFCTPYESTKILPSSSTNITVQFHVVSEDDKGVVKTPVMTRPPAIDDESEKLVEHEAEPVVIDLRTNPTKFVDTRKGIANAIDAMFTLSGYGEGCYLRSAWNAAGEPRSWEVCDEEGARPEPADTLIVLDAADSVPKPSPELSDDSTAYVYATNRFITALRALQEVRRQGYEELNDIDEGLTYQWWGVNIANTASFICDTTSAMTVYPCPPVSIGAGFTSATITVTQWIYDSVEEGKKNRQVRELIFRMQWNCMAVEELEKEWQQAQKKMDEDADLARGLDDGHLGNHMEIIRTIACNTFCITFDIVSSSAACFKLCPLGIPFWMSWFGAVGCFSVMANGWCTTKAMQTTIREMAVKLQEQSDMADDHLEKFMKATENINAGIVDYYKASDGNYDLKNLMKKSGEAKLKKIKEEKEAKDGEVVKVSSKDLEDNANDSADCLSEKSTDTSQHGKAITS